MPIPLNTQTYRAPNGQIQVAAQPQKAAMGASPANGTKTANGYTVFDNYAGTSGTAMDSRGNITYGHFDVSLSTGRSVFVNDQQRIAQIVAQNAKR